MQFGCDRRRREWARGSTPDSRRDRIHSGSEHRRSKFGTSINLMASNSSGSATQSMLVIGLSRASIPFLGGALLTPPPLILTSLPMPGSGLVLPVTVRFSSAMQGGQGE
jgi:hypothetical protein